MNSVWQKLAQMLAEQSVIDGEDLDLYAYGFEQGFLMVVNLLTTIILGQLFQMLWQSVLFMAAYIPLRSYAGGYHSKTALRCYFVSLGIMVVSLLLLKYIAWTYFLCSLILFLSVIVILPLSPVETSNKPLDESEKKVFRQRSRRICLLWLALAVALQLFGVLEAAMCISLSMFLLAILLLLGKAMAERQVTIS